MFHLDAYRIASPEEFWELGIEEMFASENWTIIEWANRVRVCLPRDYLGVEIEIIDTQARAAKLTPRGKCWENALVGLEPVTKSAAGR
ncbi:MAG: tRNA (adenosine(37)-N6)-threonylcarbamoyltransferase complex ATPase subunit type 1 TsaE [Pirellulales bacterium]|nr:tRNA (adenosine(37)-N6)-threonylcarbamoyltransferase complex ATPase subunit type 1 TsaE [Pirellulales bacterium]